MTARRKVDDALSALSAAVAQTRQATAALDRASETLQSVLQDRFEGQVETPTDVAAEHVRAHRPGRPSRIDTDPELRAFVIERVDHMPFTALAAAIRSAFPPERRVGKSALYSWWKRNL